MNWDDLRYVLETVRHGGLSGAARALRVNHATVSRRITAAEATYRTTLFDRHPSGYSPTDAGSKAACAAELMEVNHADLTRAIAALDQTLSGPLSVTAPQLFIQIALAPILAEFRTAYPDIELTVLGSNEPLNLSRREADVAIRIAAEPSETLVGTKVADQRAGVFASKTYLTRLAQDPLHQLDWLRFLHWEKPSKAVCTAYPNLRIAMRFDDMTAMLGAVRADLGATRMPCFLGDSDPELARVPGIALVPYPGIWVLTHADMSNIRRVTTFTGFISARLRKARALFDGSSVSP